MTDQPTGRPDSPPPRRNVIATAVVILLGMVLLLPGLCSVYYFDVIFMPGGVGRDALSQGVFIIWLVCAVVAFAIGAAGVTLIVRAVRR
jgi:hypothetical protein